ncbi:hypothetical protein COEREDRAFT_80738 [Coemansia reversa NRRL 1564]|uniref:Selenoprotein W-related protein n=1 Tax=Coemansia reversa (strain ATCC 12441 / NRRL 1564) TaxID=763665 RepID=A0A2G5BE80_COERN|nr:hypothetical protein COEREDRAFT_80738 [Coemansia reversa NRRL 1564]|eukprot:PIA17017.1 hypothetical protein COEREDRAFT_80738 [Coemansia reversa NRRL 1564]
MAQELLTTFSDTLGEVALVPQKGGIFALYVDGELLFDRRTEGRFPEMKEAKQLVRNKVSPDMSLGHSDSAVKSKATTKDTALLHADSVDTHETDVCLDC